MSKTKLMREFMDSNNVFQSTEKMLRTFLENPQTKQSGKPMITFTFDDGNLSDYTEGFLYMTKNGMRGTSFIGHYHLTDPERTSLSNEQIKEMADCGWEIACHGYSHPQLNELTNEELITDWTDNKKYLENITGKEVLTHAYPFSSDDSRVRSIASGVYLAACTTDYNTRATYGYERGLHDLPRFFIDKRPMQEIKDRIDEAVENNQWLIFGAHGIYPIAERKSPQEWQEIIDYVYSYKLQGKVDVVTVQEGARRII